MVCDFACVALFAYNSKSGFRAPDALPGQFSEKKYTENPFAAFGFVFLILFSAFLCYSLYIKSPCAPCCVAYKLLLRFGLLKYLFYICLRWLSYDITRLRDEVAVLPAAPQVVYPPFSSRPRLPRRLPRPLWGFSSHYPLAYNVMHIPAQAAGSGKERSDKGSSILKEILR